MRVWSDSQPALSSELRCGTLASCFGFLVDSFDFARN
jgi:hypothetical protein